MISLKWINSLTNFYLLETNFKQPGFTYSACGPFTKRRKRIQKFREIGNLKHLYRNELDKACFVHDAAYSDSKDLAKRTISDKVLKEKAHEFVKNLKYDGYQRALESMFLKFFDKKNRIRSECKWKTSWKIIQTSN